MISAHPDRLCRQCSLEVKVNVSCVKLCEHVKRKLFIVVDQPNLDLSEFPSLGRSSSLSSAISTPRNYGESFGRRVYPPVSSFKTMLSVLTVSMVNKQSQETSSEFQIQNEDFPALPGSTRKK